MSANSQDEQPSQADREVWEGIVTTAKPIFNWREMQHRYDEHGARYIVIACPGIDAEALDIEIRPDGRIEIVGQVCDCSEETEPGFWLGVLERIIEVASWDEQTAGPEWEEAFKKWSRQQAALLSKYRASAEACSR